MLPNSDIDLVGLWACPEIPVRAKLSRWKLSVLLFDASASHRFRTNEPIVLNFGLIFLEDAE